MAKVEELTVTVTVGNARKAVGELAVTVSDAKGGPRGFEEQLQRIRAATSGPLPLPQMPPSPLVTDRHRAVLQAAAQLSAITGAPLEAARRAIQRHQERLPFWSLPSVVELVRELERATAPGEEDLDELE